MSAKSRRYKEFNVARGSAFFTLLEELDATKDPKKRKELQKQVDTNYASSNEEFHKHFPREDWDRIVNALKIR